MSYTRSRWTALRAVPSTDASVLSLLRQRMANALLRMDDTYGVDRHQRNTDQVVKGEVTLTATRNKSWTWSR
jgi:hypothetical protein